MDAPSKLAFALYGFKRAPGGARPCFWCGILTILRDAEDFRVCDQCQKDYIKIGHEAMKTKYPLAGEDERHPVFFKEETDRHIARAKGLTQQELSLIMERGAGSAQDHAKKALDGQTLSENELDLLGGYAEQYIDGW